MINRFGTSSDMVIQTVEENGKTMYMAIDANGLYLTTQDKIDKLTADNNRYAGNRKSMHARISELGFCPDELISANQHRIPKETGAPAQKVNPLKASKRQARGG